MRQSGQERRHGFEDEIVVFEHSSSDSHMILARRDDDLDLAPERVGLPCERTRIRFEHRKIVPADDQQRRRQGVREVLHRTGVLHESFIAPKGIGAVTT